jgi:hypothetical protein
MHTAIGAWEGKDITVGLKTHQPKAIKGRAVRITSEGIVLDSAGQEFFIPVTAILMVSETLEERRPTVSDLDYLAGRNV